MLKAIGVSMSMNHCSVARVMTGLWQRQQCGYECSSLLSPSSAPCSFSSSMITGLDLKTVQAFVGLRRAAAEALGVHLPPRVVDILDFGQVVALAGGEVIDAVGGRGVDGSGALVGSDVGGVGAEDVRSRNGCWKVARSSAVP